MRTSIHWSQCMPRMPIVTLRGARRAGKQSKSSNSVQVAITDACVRKTPLARTSVPRGHVRSPGDTKRRKHGRIRIRRAPGTHADGGRTPPRVGAVGCRITIGSIAGAVAVDLARGDRCQMFFRRRTDVSPDPGDFSQWKDTRETEQFSREVQSAEELNGRRTSESNEVCLCV